MVCRWTYPIAYSLFIFTTLPVIPGFFQKLAKLVPLSLTVNCALSLFLCLIVIIFVCRLERNKVQALVALGGTGGFLILVLVRIQVPVERIHIFEYGILAILFFRAIAPDLSHLKAYLISFELASVMGVVDELIQNVLPNRHFQFTDVILNVSGAAVGLAACYLYSFLKNKHLR